MGPVVMPNTFHKNRRTVHKSGGTQFKAKAFFVRDGEGFASAIPSTNSAAKLCALPESAIPKIT